MTTPEAIADAVLAAAGSALHHYTPQAREAILAAAGRFSTPPPVEHYAPARVSGWQPIETAPSGEAILVAYDDGSVEGITAEGNDYDFRPYRGRRIIGVITPTHWMPLPTPPSGEAG